MFFPFSRPRLCLFRCMFFRSCFARRYSRFSVRVCACSVACSFVHVLPVVIPVLPSASVSVPLHVLSFMFCPSLFPFFRSCLCLFRCMFFRSCFARRYSRFSVRVCACSVACSFVHVLPVVIPVFPSASVPVPLFVLPSVFVPAAFLVLPFFSACAIPVHVSFFPLRANTPTARMRAAARTARPS